MATPRPPALRYAAVITSPPASTTAARVSLSSTPVRDARGANGGAGIPAAGSAAASPSNVSRSKYVETLDRHLTQIVNQLKVRDYVTTKELEDAARAFLKTCPIRIDIRESNVYKAIAHLESDINLAAYILESTNPLLSMPDEIEAFGEHRLTIHS